MASNPHGASSVFIDWVTATQHHPGGRLPIIVGGLVVWHDSRGNVRAERASPASLGGSHSTAVRVGCDGARVFLTGNPGRFNRPDNLFNFGWPGTVDACNRILARLGLPGFSATPGISEETGKPLGARLLRLDLTSNFRAGSQAQGQAVIRWLAAQSVARVKRGAAGSESVWWANTRQMIKAYLKASEMVAHGASVDDEAVVWCREQGVVRVEVELKRLLLKDIGMETFDTVSDERIAQVYRERTEILRRVDRSDDPDVLAEIPARYRMTAAAWMAGQDVSSMMSRATLFRHAKVLRGFGIDVFQVRNVYAFPVAVRVVELQALDVPEWYRPRLKVA